MNLNAQEVVEAMEGKSLKITTRGGVTLRGHLVRFNYREIVMNGIATSALVSIEIDDRGPPIVFTDIERISVCA